MQFVEVLESRQLLSGTGAMSEIRTAALSVAGDALHVRRQAPATATHGFIYAFYGLGGTGFGNQSLAQLANDAGSTYGLTVGKYQYNEIDSALTNFLSAIDTNHDHIIQASEIANISVNLVGYSYGGITAANFSRDLVKTRRGIDGYTLKATIPVRRLITIDPVNYTPGVSTSGPENNVQEFFNYWQAFNFNSTIQLTVKHTTTPAGSVNYDVTLPLGGLPLSSSAQSSTQIEVDAGSWAGTVSKHSYNRADNGSLAGDQTDHTTMPFYVYPFAIADLA